MQQNLDDLTRCPEPILSMLNGHLERCTQAELAEKIGISPQYFSEILRGRRPPNDKVLDFLSLEKVIVYRPAPDGAKAPKKTRRR